MKFVSCLLFAGLALAATLVVAQSPKPTGLGQQLRASRWQKRVLLFGAPTAGQADFQQQKKLIAAVPDQLR